MFLACLECFKVVEQWRPFDDQGVVPMICPGCQKHDDRARQKLGIQSGRNLKSHKSLLANHPKLKKTSVAR